MKNLEIFSFSRWLEIHGNMPERAIKRLQRAQIPLFSVRKTAKNTMLLRVREKDIAKVFAIYPKMCYNKATSSAYLVQDKGGAGLQKAVDFCKTRVAFLLGAVLCCIGCLAIEPYVFGVKIVGSSVYEREILHTLESFGAKPFSKYPLQNQEKITAQLLALEGVEFCSVQKQGNQVVVEMRLDPLSKSQISLGDMLSQKNGVILSIVALSGTPLKKAGESVQVGEKLVGGYFQTQSGEYKGVQPIARVRISCVCEEEVLANSPQEAFATVLLGLNFSSNCTLTAKEITLVSPKIHSQEQNQQEKNQENQREKMFHVKIDYIFTQIINL